MRRLGIQTMAAISLLAPASAAAQTSTLEATTPEGRKVVLTVRDSNDQYCLSVKVADEGPSRTSPCAAPPASAQTDVNSVHVVYRATPEKLTIIHGVLSPQTAKLQLRFGNNRLVELTPQNERRAYLAVFRGRPPLASTRAVGADGRDLAAADIDPRAMRIEPRRGPITLRKVLDERGSQTRFDAFTTPLLPPGSLRRRPATCVAVGDRRPVPHSNTEPGYPGGSACTFERGRVVVKYAAGCFGAKRLLLFGIGPAVIRSYALVTKTGRRYVLLTNRLPRKLRRSSYRAFIYSGFDVGALDRLEAYARGAKLVATVPLDSIGSGCVSNARS